MQPPPVALLFDLDNTLFDREAAFRGVAEDFYAEFLAPAALTSRDEAVALMEEWDEDGYSNRREFREAFIAHWPEADLDFDALSAWYRQAMDRRTLPDASVNGFLGDVNRAGVPWGIVTNGDGHNQRNKCRLARLGELTRFIIVSGEQGYEKPDSRIFAYALAAMGLTSPESVLFVGDNPVTDMEGARAFGMRTAWVSRGRSFPPDLPSPDLVIERVADLRPALGL
ncbi:MAG: HAD family hydrolase [Chloroflexota bacterium]|nr:HAD family hydrolase [Chloroflexota bacterium]